MNRMNVGPFSELFGKSKDQKAKEPGESSLLEADVEPDPLTTEFIRAELGHTDLASSYFLPLHYESRHAYPLLVWLHGADQDIHQLNSVMPWISEQNYIGLSIGSPNRLSESAASVWRQSCESIEQTSNLITAAIDCASQRFSIHPDRVFIAGHDIGGTMAFRVAFQSPERFAGVASFNGSLPSNLTPLLNWRMCRHLPLFWAHGRHSTEFPETNLCYQLKLLYTAGFDVNLRQYPCHDTVCEQAYRDSNTWIMEQIAKSNPSIIK